MDFEPCGIVDLSLSRRRPDSSGSTSSSKRSGSPPASMSQYNNIKRSLRPRTEVKNYVETTDVVVVSDIDEYKQNGYINGYEYSDSDDGAELPPLIPPKEISATERLEVEKRIKILKDELRNEEMKLVLLKKLRQSQQMKENISSILPVSNNSSNISHPGPTSHSSNSSKTASNHRSSPVHHDKHSTSIMPPMLKGQLMPPGRSAPPPLSPVVNNHQSSRSSTSGMPPNMFPIAHRGSNSPNSSSQLNVPAASVNLLNNKSAHMSSSGRNIVAQAGGGNAVPNSSSNSYQNSISLHDRIKEVAQSTVVSAVNSTSPSFSLTGASGSSSLDRQRNEDTQTPAQRQAAAKLALRKQLEKTLLQIPPPKPPPPEMHFIPNPSNTEFIYLLGLEHVVDYITKDQKIPPPPPEPFQCSQCGTNFTPLWKWEKNATKGKEPKVICEACVTSNVKKALKAEHTNRLKTAFVKALQQEQEIEQRLSQTSPPHPPDSPAPVTISNQQQQSPVQTPAAHQQQPQPLPPPLPAHQPVPAHQPLPPSQPHLQQSQLSHSSRDSSRESALLTNTAVGGGNTRDHHPLSAALGVGNPIPLIHHNSISSAVSPGQQPTPPTSHKTSSTSSSSTTGSSSKRSNPTPLPVPRQPSPAPTPPTRDHHLSKLAADSTKFSPHHAAAAAAALHQQLMRGFHPHQQPLPAHMLQFPPALLYPYQLAMAQAASSNKNPVAAAATLAEFQRQAADLQRQYLLDMIPTATAAATNNSSTSSRHNSHPINSWKSS